MNDIELLYKTYSQGSFGPLWPLSEADFSNYLFDEPENIRVSLIKDGDGFAVLKTKEDKGSIILLTTIDNDKVQRTEKKLLEKTISIAKNQGVKFLFFGHKVGKYLWPGLPFKPNKLELYTQYDFKYYWDQPAEDLIQDITDFRPPKTIYTKIEPLGFQIVQPANTDLEKLIQFEDSEFPNWTQHYRKVINKNEINKLLVVKNNEGRILGATILFWGDYLYRNLLDGLAGGAGAVGIAKDLRSQGLGLAMQAKALEILRDNRVKYAIVEYTSVPEFYKKLGFKCWKKYHMLKKEL